MRNYMYILVMAVTTYLIRAVPITLMRKEIKNRTFCSFLTYVPYVTLAVMTFPGWDFWWPWCWRIAGPVYLWCHWGVVFWCLCCSCYNT